MTRSKDVLPKIDLLFPFHRIDELFFLALNSALKSTGVILRIIFIDNRLDRTLPLEAHPGFASISCEYVVVKDSFCGYANALNSGLRHLESEYVGLMNSDDLVSRDKFKSQITKLLSQESDICVGKIVKFSDKGYLPSLTGTIDVDQYKSEFLLLGAYGADSSIVFKATIANDLLFDDLAKSSDWTTALTHYWKFKVCGDNSAEYFYRIHSGQTTSQESYFSENFVEVFQHWSEYNERLSLPKLDFDSARALAACHETTVGSKIDFAEIGNWTQKYLELFQNPKTKAIANRLIKRRIVILKIRHKRMPKYLMTTMILIFEVIETLLKGSRPRGMFS
jgi:hypothetical protein